MKITVKIHRDEILDEHFSPAYLLLKKNQSRWQAFGAGAALGGGFLCPIIGTVLSLLCSYTRFGADKPILSKMSLILYLLTIPLLMLGAHFLDLLEKTTIESCEAELDFIDQPAAQFALPTKAEDY